MPDDSTRDQQEQQTRAHLCLVRPRGYLHSSALEDPLRYVAYQLRRSGVSVTQGTNQLREDAINLVFGAHLGFDAALLRRFRCVVVNLEQLGVGGSAWPAEYVSLLRRAAVVDYHPENLPAYARPGGGSALPLLPFGFAPYLRPDEVVPLDQRPIDALFIGSTSPRRVEILTGLQRQGLAVVAPQGPSYGAARDALVRQAKMVVNVGAYETSRFEQVRASFVLSNGTPLLSERREGRRDLIAGFETCVRWFSQGDPVRVPELLSAEGLTELAAGVDRFRTVDPREEYADLWRAVTSEVGGPPSRRTLAPAPTPAPAADRRTRTDDHSVAIIVPVQGDPDRVLDCLGALVENTAEAGVEVVVVDDASQDGARELLAQLSGDVTVIRNENPVGRTAAFNQAAGLTRAAHLVFLRPDHLVQDGWLTPLLKTLSDRDVALVGGLVLDRDGGIMSAGLQMAETTDGFLAARSMHEGRAISQTPEALVPSRPTAVGGGLTAAVRETFLALGGFRAGLDDEEAAVDFSLTAAQAGLLMAFEPSCIAVSLDRPTTGTVRSARANGELQHRWISCAVPEVFMAEPEVPHPASATIDAAEVWRAATRRRLASGARPAVTSV